MELGGQREKAVTYLHRAGEEAASRFANAEALNFYTRALNLCQENDLESLFDLRVIRLNILHRMGQRDQEEQDLLAAETTAERLNDSEKLAAINWHWAIFHANTGDNDAAIECAKACTNMARELGNQELEARGHLAWGRVLWRQGKLSEAHSRLQNALLLARKAGLKRLEANALLNLGNVVGDQGDIPGARSYYDQSLAIDRETKNHTGEGIVLNNLGILSAQGGNFVDAQTYFEQSLEIAKLTGNIAGEGLALGNLGNVTADRGDFASSRDYFEQYLTNAQRTRNRPGQGYALNGIGHALLGLGQCVEAAKYYKEAVQLREDLKVEHLAIESRAGWARSVLAAGDGPQALRLVEPILTFIESSGTLDRFESLLIYLTCIHVLQANEDLRSEQLLQTAYELVQGQANKINDPDERRSFLENVEANHEIMRLWWSAHSITK